MASRNSVSNLASDYANLRTIPAILGIVFGLASLYQFGGIATVELVWLNYTLGTQHAMLISLGTYAIAFASSETKSLEYYEDWEKVLIAAGPALIVGQQYVGFIGDMIANNGTAGGVVAFVIALVSWGVAVR
jgi:hypothetical protein